jgi:phage shock protein E
MRVSQTLLLATLTLCGCASPGAPPAPSAQNGPTPQQEVAPSSPLAGAAAVIDVRTPEEVAQGHLEGALLIPVAELEARMAEVDAAVGGDKHKKVVTYCKSGGRAGRAKLALEQHGYTNVVNGGGYDALK